jgi:hypothetical protein
MFLTVTKNNTNNGRCKFYKPENGEREMNKE